MKIAFLGNHAVSYSSETHHKKSLEALGHEVIPLQERDDPGERIVAEALTADLFVWVHTHGWSNPGFDPRALLRDLRHRAIPSATFHLDLWSGLERQKDMRSDAYWDIEHFFTVDRLMADWLNANTPVRGHYLQAAVFEPDCALAPTPDPSHDVIFVGSKGYHPEWPYRPKLINWLARTYGPRFEHHGGDGLGTIRGAELNALYADTRVAVGDSLCIGFDYPGYWSDRAYETLGRGGFLIHPYVAGMEEHFTDGEHLVFYEYGDFGQLKTLVDHYLKYDDARERIRAAGHAHVKENHTYTHRWAQILREIGR